MDIRPAEEAEVGTLADVWYEGWQDAHAHILPGALAALRTRESFERRLRSLLPTVRVIGPAGAPLGFCIVKADEIYQLYVSARARGSGVANALLDDAEDRMRSAGVETAWLGCAIGNDRAARFYTKCGWHRTGTIVSQLDTSDGLFPLSVWRYEKPLLHSAGDSP